MLCSLLEIQNKKKTIPASIFCRCNYYHKIISNLGSVSGYEIPWNCLCRKWKLYFQCLDSVQLLIRFIKLNPVTDSWLILLLIFKGNESNEDRSFLRNKVAQITSLAFVADYPSRWPTFFTDLIGILSASAKAVDIYLRVLLSIDSEVVDREIVHTFEVYLDWLFNGS